MPCSTCGRNDVAEGIVRYVLGRPEQRILTLGTPFRVCLVFRQLEIDFAADANNIGS